ncbi:MAG: hypothetical protein ABII12_00340 [Planctomycetota bacterium]
MTVLRDSKAFETEVVVGVEAREFVQVTDGLSTGDLVVTEGGYGLPEGCPVRPLPDSPSGPVVDAPTERQDGGNLDHGPDAAVPAGDAKP